MEKNGFTIVVNPICWFLFNVFFEKAGKTVSALLERWPLWFRFLLVYFFIQINQNETTLFEFHCLLISSENL
jgi:hypothetical protein